jgi:hypothetical protein
MDKVQEDIRQIEKDLEEIRCNPIIKFCQDCFKCIEDSIAYFFKKNE